MNLYMCYLQMIKLDLVDFFFFFFGVNYFLCNNFDNDDNDIIMFGLKPVERLLCVLERCDSNFTFNCFGKFHSVDSLVVIYSKGMNSTYYYFFFLFPCFHLEISPAFSY